VIEVISPSGVGKPRLIIADLASITVLFTVRRESDLNGTTRAPVRQDEIPEDLFGGFCHVRRKRPLSERI
jgi:hypothetical protein